MKMLIYTCEKCGKTYTRGHTCKRDVDPTKIYTWKSLGEKYPPATFGVVNVRRGGAGFDDDRPAEIEDVGWDFYLEHSCDEWRIGDMVEAQRFINNLSEAISYCRKLSQK